MLVWKWPSSIWSLLKRLTSIWSQDKYACIHRVYLSSRMWAIILHFLLNHLLITFLFIVYFFLLILASDPMMCLLYHYYGTLWFPFLIHLLLRYLYGHCIQILLSLLESGGIFFTPFPSVVVKGRFTLRCLCIAHACLSPLKAFVSPRLPIHHWAFGEKRHKDRPWPLWKTFDHSGVKGSDLQQLGHNHLLTTGPWVGEWLKLNGLNEGMLVGKGNHL